MFLGSRDQPPTTMMPVSPGVVSPGEAGSEESTGMKGSAGAAVAAGAAAGVGAPLTVISAESVFTLPKLLLYSQ